MLLSHEFQLLLNFQSWCNQSQVGLRNDPHWETVCMHALLILYWKFCQAKLWWTICDGSSLMHRQLVLGILAYRYQKPIDRIRATTTVKFYLPCPVNVLKGVMSGPCLALAVIWKAFRWNFTWPWMEAKQCGDDLSSVTQKNHSLSLYKKPSALRGRVWCQVNSKVLLGPIIFKGVPTCIFL